MINLDYLNKYKLFIVDYDGTILNSMRMWDKLLSDFLKYENIYFTENIDEINSDKTNIEVIKYLKDNYFKDLTIEEIDKKIFDFAKVVYPKQLLKNNAEKLLIKLKNIGRVVLFSATPSVLLEESFKKNNVNKYFSKIYSASDLKTTKTMGKGYEVVLKLEGYDKKDTLILEDVNQAIEGAKLLNFDTLAIYDEQKNWEELKKISDYNLNLEEI